jgi:hypothetical protein
MADQTDALTRRAERTRNHLTELVDSLQSQITPAELVGQLVGRRAQHVGNESFVDVLMAQVKRNPLACILIAAGVGWLMISERADSNRPPRRTRVRSAAVKRRRSRKKGIS